MQNIFDFRNDIIEEYKKYSRSFVKIKSEDIKKFVDNEYLKGRYWPAPLIQINPSFKYSGSIQNKLCIFCIKSITYHPFYILLESVC